MRKGTARHGLRVAMRRGADSDVLDVAADCGMAA